VIEHKAAAASVQRTGHPLDRDVDPPPAIASDRQHLPPAHRFQIAVKLFVEQQPGDRHKSWIVLGWLWQGFDVKWPAGKFCHLEARCS
jgi:hypothetical protein